MTLAEAIAYVQSQTVCALAEIEGMKAENAMRERRGESPAYVHEQFAAVPDRFGIGHNAVCGMLQDAMVRP